jgi:phage repressor protein C with HTH and peptisase S24 domain
VKTLGERLKEAREAAGLSMQELGEAAGVTKQAVAAIEAGGSLDPKASTLLALARKLRMSPEALLWGRRDSKIGEATIAAYSVRAIDGEDGLDPEREVLIPEVDVELSGGPGAWMPEFIETKTPFPYQIAWFQSHGVNPANVVRMRVRGNSMEPTLYDGDIVAIDRGAQRIIDGGVFALFYGEQARIKRLFVLADGSLRVTSDNPAYPEEIIPPDVRDQVYIVGRAIERQGFGGLGHTNGRAPAR